MNQVTQPFGLKLFGGSNYSDGGALDRQQNQAAPMAAVGNSLIQQGSHLPGLGDMGVLQYLPQIFAQLSSLTGAQNPMNPSQQTGVNRGAQRNPGDVNEMGGALNQYDQSPFALNPVQQAGLNQQNSQASQNEHAIMARIRSNLSARGLTNSSHMDAAQAYLRGQLTKQQNQNRAGAGYNAYQSRLDTTNQFGNMLNSIYGQQTQRQGQLLNSGQNLISPQLQNTGAQANLAQQNSANALGPLGSLAGSYFGGLFKSPSKPNPFTGGASSAGGGIGAGLGNAGMQNGLSNYTWNYP